MRFIKAFAMLKLACCPEGAHVHPCSKQLCHLITPPGSFRSPLSIRIQSPSNGDTGVDFPIAVSKSGVWLCRRGLPCGGELISSHKLILHMFGIVEGQKSEERHSDIQEAPRMGQCMGPHFFSFLLGSVLQCGDRADCTGTRT